MRAPDPQLQPDSISCVPTATSMAVDGATAGNRKPSVYALRRAEDDFSGGMDYIQMTDATVEVSGVKSWATFGTPTSNVLATVEAGRFVVASIDTNVTAPYPEVRTYTFRGGHSILLVATGYSVWPNTGEPCSCEKHAISRHGEFTYKDPGTSKGFHQISASLLYRAMLTRADNNGCNILVLPDVTNVRRAVVKDGWIRTQPSNASGKVRRLVLRERLTVLQAVTGTRWRRSDGSYSNGWYKTSSGYVRADKLGVTNVA